MSRLLTPSIPQSAAFSRPVHFCFSAAISRLRFFSSASLPPSFPVCPRLLARDCTKRRLGERSKHSASARDPSEHQPAPANQPCPKVISLHQSHKSSPFFLGLPPLFHGGTSSGCECLNFIYQPHYGASKPTIDSNGTHLNF